VIRPLLSREYAAFITCKAGWITLGQLVVDPDTGEEAEEFALYLCRKCAERS
jgi:hypothetical protein